MVRIDATQRQFHSPSLQGLLQLGKTLKSRSLCWGTVTSGSIRRINASTRCIPSGRSTLAVPDGKGPCHTRPAQVLHEKQGT